MNLYSLLDKQSPSNAPVPSCLASRHSGGSCVKADLCTAVCPDVVIVVGGQAFTVPQHILRLCSRYFEGAMSNVKHTRTRIQFPYRKSEEWIWIVSLMSAPESKGEITLQNLSIALHWFGMLGFARGLEQCDEVLCRDFLGQLVGHDDCSAFLTTVLDCLDMSIDKDLQASKRKCFAIVKRALIRCSTWFTANKAALGRLTRLVKDNKECHKELWSIFKVYIPSSISEDKQMLLLQNDLLHEFIYMEMLLRQTLTQSLNQVQL